MISFKHISFCYSNQGSIFQDFTWKVSTAERWAVLGPSGCGKSTLLYLIAGLISPSQGTITVNKKPLSRPRPETGLIIQDYGLLPWATVRENASLGITIRTFYGPDGTHAPMNFRQSHQSVDYWLERLNLLPHANKYPKQLSGGQRQRTAIARTLTLQPDLILMDEPFGSLDAPSRESLQDLTLDLQKEEAITMVIVTHAIEEAAVLGSKVLVLSHPPNTTPLILENPNSGSYDYRQGKSFQQTCQTLRAMMT